MLRFLLHYGIHFLAPVVVGLLLFKERRTFVIFVLLLGIVIDIDHFLASPIFDSNRCSIGFHPLHSHIAIGIYVVLFSYPKTRIFGLALLLHILADTVDCLLIP